MPYVVTDKSTPHGENTPHGFATPHKFPVTTAQSSKILSILAKSLYPTGRAWSMNENGMFEKLHGAIDLSFARLIDDAKATINSTIPDSVLFDEDDVNIWEYRLGLISNLFVPLDQRRQSVLRKLAYPANVKARQHPLYIQSQLQAAGFDVYIHENTKPYRTPDDIISGSLVSTQHGGDTQHGGGTQHGEGGFEVIANSLNPTESFNIGGANNLWSTFFIAGLLITDIAVISADRQVEFRELVLKLKPAHTVAFTFINFV